MTMLQPQVSHDRLPLDQMALEAIGSLKINSVEKKRNHHYTFSHGVPQQCLPLEISIYIYIGLS